MLSKLTDIQFLVIDLIGPREVYGRDLRELLKKNGRLKSGPAFYQLMGRMEGLVESTIESKVLDNGQRVNEKKYHVTGAGRKAYEETRTFYKGNWEGDLACTQ